MNWHALRYCIGFPPELWYRIADEGQQPIYYFADAIALHPLSEEETAPISPSVPADARRIDVRLGEQVVASTGVSIRRTRYSKAAVMAEATRPSTVFAATTDGGYIYPAVLPSPDALYALGKVEGSFTDEDVEIMEALSSSVALALDNASYYESLMKSHTE